MTTCQKVLLMIFLLSVFIFLIFDLSEGRLIKNSGDPVAAHGHELQATTPSGSGGGFGQDQTGIDSHGRMLINKQATPGTNPRAGTGSHAVVGKRNQTDRVGEADRKKEDTMEAQQAVLKHRDARGHHNPGVGHPLNKERVDEKGVSHPFTKGDRVSTEADRKKGDHTTEEQQAVVLKHRCVPGGPGQHSRGVGHPFNKECVDEKGSSYQQP